jgi:hypothetical protein
MAIEIVSFPMKHGDFPYKSWFSHGFPTKHGDFPSFFHVYQRVKGEASQLWDFSNISRDFMGLNEI